MLTIEHWKGKSPTARFLCAGWFILVSVLFVFSFTAVAEVTQVTTTNGITVNFKLPQLQIKEVPIDTQSENTGAAGVHHTVQYTECNWVHEPGFPKLPATRVLLAIPADAQLNKADVAVNTGTSQAHNGARFLPYQVETPVSIDRDSDNAGSLQSDSSVGNRHKIKAVNLKQYPGVLARIEMDGYIRSQRVISLALYPVQYNTTTRQLRSYNSLTVFIPFKTQPQPRASRTVFNPTRTDPYEQVYRQHILNYADYRRVFNVDLNGGGVFHNRAGELGAAPAAHNSQQTRYKLYIDETGVHQVTAASLKTDWGIDLIGIDPRKLRITHADKDIPIYVSGAVDGRFDAEDAIVFLAHSSTDSESPFPKNAYTLWNVYWLSIAADGQQSPRVPQIEASPSDATAIQVPTFRSRVIFEEDHLSNNLEFVYPEAVSGGDKHKWFDALDFWFWDGIKNASDIGELRLDFPIYDVAKSFDPPKMDLVLQGGTPVTHQILASVNGVRIDLAEWDRQAQVTLSKNLRVWNNLKDAAQGENNVLSLTRIDSNYEEDTTRYPYHIYLNRFWVEYTRLFLVVNDELRFGTPIKATQESEKKGVTHQFRIDAFFDPQVSVFETDGNTLTAKLQGVNVTRNATDDVMRARLRAFNAGDLRGVPNHTYTATFQIPDTRTTEFIAVSNAALRKPAKIETVQPSDLRNPLNGVDYLVLTHARFREAADRLAEWRSTTKGGGYRTKVVDVMDVYNTFGDGKVHPKWIKDFLTYAYQNWTLPALSYFVILGDGTYDFRGIDKEIHPDPPELAGYIPPHYIPTDSFGRTSADHWYGTVSGHDEFVDFYLGRLSVETKAEADIIVDKIINYEAQRPNGAWRRRIISVADDEVSNSGDDIFKRSLNEIAKDHTRLGYETVEIYLEDVIDEVEANPEDYPKSFPQHVAKERIITALGEGGVVAQYAGHGGRVVWAHEIIFDNTSIDKVKETDHLPFMLVLSCYNGYFDKPGEPSMAEKLLRKERGGIIGMLSATRLTYGSGNDSLNRIIFDLLFQRNVRQLGPLSFDSKLEYLMMEGTSQLDIMLEYTLFGDPALRIAMADYEILPKIETKTVKAGGTLKIAPGYIQIARYDAASQKKVFTRNTSFNGELTVKATFPGQQSIGVDKTGAPKEFYSGDVLVTETLQVKNGKFDDIKIEVPKNISPGDAHVEYYAENDTEVAVGGDGFTVEIPKILDIQTKLITTESGEDKIDISAHISDNNKETVSVVLEWRNPLTANRDLVDMELVDMNAESTSSSVTTARWWKIPEPLPAPTDGSAFRYDIQITDADGFVVISDYFRFYPYTEPNLSVVSKRYSDIEQISYTSSEQRDGINEQILSVDIEVTGTSTSSDDSVAAERDLITELGLSEVDIEVVFFSGNPDIDEDGIIDVNANILGLTHIKPDDWGVRNPLLQRSNAYISDPLNINPIATVSIPASLRNGVHDVFVYIDPIYSEGDEPGKVRENNERDNLGYRQITVSESVIGAVPTRVTSIDGGLRLIAPAGAIQNEPAVMSISPIVSDTTDSHYVYYLGGTGEVSNNKQNLPFPIVRGDHNENHVSAMLYPVALPTHPSVQGYTLQLNDTAADQWNAFKLQTPVTVELDYDYMQIRQEIVRELFGSDPDVLIEEPSIEERVKMGVETRASTFGVYLWIDTIANWVRLDSSKVKKQANGKLYTSTRATHIRSKNSGDGTLVDVEIAPEGTDIGAWIVLFESERTYRLLYMPEPTGTDADTEQPKLEVVQSGISLLPFSHFGTSFSNTNLGFLLDIEVGETSFQYGDMLRFDISRIEAPGEVENQFYATSFNNRNSGDGTVQYLELPPETTMPQDTWLILFVSPTQFQIEGKNSGVLVKNGVPIYGTAGKPFEHSDYGLKLLITQGPDPFEVGDRFVFSTSIVGTIQVETSYLGTMTCLRSEDSIPPDIQLTVGNQKHFIDGAPVDNAPLIQATLTDARGIDYITRPVKLELGRFGEFETIADTDYKLTHHPGSTQLTLTYNSPELEPREYQLRLTASDLDGNTGGSEVDFQVHGQLQLVEPLNYPNPFSKNTTLTCELTRPGESLTVKIYTVTGRLIRELETEATAGFIQLKWDGKDDDGNEVANGVYFGKFIVKSLDDDEDDQTHILKMMKLK